MSMLLQINTEEVVFNADNLLKMCSKMGWRLLIDLATVFVLVRLIYFRIYKNREYFFMFVAFNLVIFTIAFLLNKVDLSLGAAFGLFAVFGMLRYRAENISIKDMTYLFLCIAIGLVTAVTKIKDTPDFYEYLFIAGLNVIILAIIFLLETNKFIQKEHTKYIVYEKINLLPPDRKEELLADLKTRTGLNIQRFQVERIDFLKDTALIKVYYYEGGI